MMSGLLGVPGGRRWVGLELTPVNRSWNQSKIDQSHKTVSRSVGAVDHIGCKREVRAVHVFPKI